MCPEEEKINLTAYMLRIDKVKEMMKAILGNFLKLETLWGTAYGLKVL